MEKGGSLMSSGTAVVILIIKFIHNINSGQLDFNISDDLKYM